MILMFRRSTVLCYYYYYYFYVYSLVSTTNTLFFVNYTTIKTVASAFTLPSTLYQQYPLLSCSIRSRRGGILLNNLLPSSSLRSFLTTTTTTTTTTNERISRYNTDTNAGRYIYTTTQLPVQYSKNVYYTTVHNRNENNYHNIIQRTMSSSSSSDAVTTTTTTEEELNTVATNYRRVYDHIQQITTSLSSLGSEDENNNQRTPVRLVAVSKTKPIELLHAVYNAGCRHFGENYIQELIQKVEYWRNSSNENNNNDNNNSNDIQWHFIGALQSNKCQAIINCFQNHLSQLTIETISSIKLATKLNTAIKNVIEKNQNNNNNNNNNNSTTEQQRLKVFVQVNTSGEDTKSGIEPNHLCNELCYYIIKECPYLQFCGLMTIGAPGDTSCFTTLVQCRTNVIQYIQEQQQQQQQSDSTTPSTTVTITPFELSMGMSDDYEAAIYAGSTNVRVGSTIFGHRIYPTTTTSSET